MTTARLSRAWVAIALLASVPVTARAQATGGSTTDPAAPEDSTASGSEGTGTGEAGTGASNTARQAPTAASSATSDADVVAPLTDEQRRILVPAGGEVPTRDDAPVRRFILPPYAWERGADYETRVVFPLYFQNRTHDEHRLLVGPYFRLRGPDVQADIFAPLVFNWRGQLSGGGTFGTTIVPPVWVHTERGPERAHAASYGVLPLFSYSEAYNRNGRLEAEHLVMPPLLTYHRWWPHGQTTVVGPVVYVRNRQSVDLEVLPLYFSHSSPTDSWKFILPLLTFWRQNHETNRTLTVVGPFFTESSPDSFSVNVAPVFFHAHDRTHSRTTFFPLFHTQSGPDSFTFASVLGGYTRDGNETSLILPFYQNHRGDTDLDAVAPIFFYSRNRRLGQRTIVFAPFAFHSQSPSGFAWGAFPFFARFHEYGRYDTYASPLFVHSVNHESHTSATWVFPSFHTETGPASHFFNVYPLVYTAAGRDWHHTVIAPILWDIGNETAGTQTTIVAPFFGRVSTRTSMYQYVFPNHVYWEQRNHGNRTSFGWDFFPFAQYGEPNTGDHYWSVLEGLVGYRKQGGYERMSLFWIPFNIGRQPPGASQQSRNGRAGDVLLEM